MDIARRNVENWELDDYGQDLSLYLDAFGEIDELEEH